MPLKSKALRLARRLLPGLLAAALVYGSVAVVCAGSYTYKTSDTIRGITYHEGDAFTLPNDAPYYSSSSDDALNRGTKAAGTAVKYGRTVYYDGELATYPYNIYEAQYSDISSGFYTTIAAFPYATYTITYNANGGSGAPDSQTKTYGTSLTLSSTVPVRLGYTFLGWSASSTGSVAYKAGEAYTANANAILYAVWRANTYTISFRPEGGSGTMPDQTITYGVNTALSENTFVRKGYAFAGWYAYRASDSKWYTDNGWYTADEIGANGYTKHLYGDKAVVSKTSSTNGDRITMYAQWTPMTYSVLYDANGGEGSMEEQTFSVGTATEISECTFTCEGKQFAGWSLAKDGAVEYSDRALVTDIASAGETATLYAVWVKATGFDTTSLYEDENMFSGCVNLEGGNGTHYSNGHVDSEYARIDRNGAPGYFTQK